MYFCNVYAWILIKYQLHFDFLVVFTLLVRPCQLLYYVSWLLYYWSLHFFFFCTNEWWAITGNNVLCLFEATLQRRSWSRDFLRRCKSTIYRCQRAFHCSAKQPKFCYCCSQPFYSSFVALLEVILQRCSFRTGCIVSVKVLLGQLFSGLIV